MRSYRNTFLTIFHIFRSAPLRHAPAWISDCKDWIKRMTCRICVYFRQRCPRVIVETPPFGHYGRGEGAKSGVGSSVVMTTEPPNVLQATALRWSVTEICVFFVFVNVCFTTICVFTFHVFSGLMGCQKWAFFPAFCSNRPPFCSNFPPFSSIFPPFTPSKHPLHYIKIGFFVCSRRNPENVKT